MVERLIRSERAVFREIAGSVGGVILDLESGAFRRVNAMGTVIWHALAASPTHDELVETVRSELPAPPDDLDAQVRVFMDGLVERNLARRA